MYNIIAVFDAAPPPNNLVLGLSAGEIVIISFFIAVCLFLIIRIVKKRNKKDERDD